MTISDRHPFLLSTPDMLEIAKPLKHLGITYFTYTRCEKDGGRTYLTTHPKLLKKYLDEEYYLIGNVEGPPLEYQNQILFWDTLPKQHIYDEIPRAHNIDHGIFMVKREKNYSEFYGFAAQKGNTQVINSYINNVDALKNFIHFFKEKAQKIITQANASKLILPFHNAPLDFVKKSQEFLFDPKNADIEITLSPRQVNCAALLLQGMQYKEIANILGLSPRTIESHFEVLRLKLKCRNKTELLLKLAKLIERYD